jgi:ornithine carbamoyltransferase
MPHFLSLSDLAPEGLITCLDTADEHQRTRGLSEARRPLEGKSIALVFEKASTRTRVSLEVAVYELGGHPIILTNAGSQLGRGEPMADSARVLSRMVHGITLRTTSDARLQELAVHSAVPVVNALSDGGHPMQLLADLQTVRRHKGRLHGLRYAWIGDGNNMAFSWIEAAGLLKLDLCLACPEGYDPDLKAVALAKERGAQVRVVRDPKVAVENADVVSTDVFTSMGQEEQAASRRAAFRDMVVSRELLALAHPDVRVMHCLPAHRGEEIEAEVIDGPASIVWDQAEARLHTAKAVLEWALAGDA